MGRGNSIAGYEDRGKKKTEKIEIQKMIRRGLRSKAKRTKGISIKTEQNVLSGNETVGGEKDVGRQSLLGGKAMSGEQKHSSKNRWKRLLPLIKVFHTGGGPVNPGERSQQRARLSEEEIPKQIARGGVLRGVQEIYEKWGDRELIIWVIRPRRKPRTTERSWEKQSLAHFKISRLNLLGKVTRREEEE